MVGARTAILLALRQGPGYGRQLMRRVEAATGGRASLAPGSVYPVLRRLAGDRLVRKWTLVAGRVRGGRSRTYHELTLAGIREAESEARALAGLALAGRPALPVSPEERVAMRARVQRAAALFEFAAEAHASLVGTRRKA
jgi:DNA-binding PadR family transcriptional regulator